MSSCGFGAQSGTSRPEPTPSGTHQARLGARHHAGFQAASAGPVLWAGALPTCTQRWWPRELVSGLRFNGTQEARQERSLVSQPLQWRLEKDNRTWPTRRSRGSRRTREGSVQKAGSGVDTERTA